MRSDAPKPDGGQEGQDPPTFTPRTEFGEQSTKSKVVGRPGCPSEETLILLAAGVDDAATRAAALHAAACPMCKSQLALLVRDEHFVAGVRGMISAPLAGPGAGRSEEYRRREEEAQAFILPGYAVEGEIHRGGQGIVYRAVQLDTKRAVAVKMLLRGQFATPRELRRFEREVEIAASLRHPHIVTIYDNITLDDGRSALAMELVEGVTIDAWARGRVNGHPDRAPRTVAQRAGMIAAIARAVQYAHNRAIIHRDLKPANVLVDAEDQPHVLDFGLARRTLVDHETSMMSGAAPREASIFVSLAGIFNGTPAYASPEQLSGDPLLVDTRCDVYSLGIMLYELVTGRLPTSFDDHSPDAKTEQDGIAAIIAKKTSGRFPTPMEAAEITRSPRVDADLDAIIMKAMAVDKDARYQTADRFAADIDRYLAGEAVAARVGERWYRVRKTIRKYRKSLGVGATIVIALLGFGVYYAVVALRLDENAMRLGDQARTLALQRDEILDKRDALRAELDRSEVRLARAELQLGNVPRAEAALISAALSKPLLDEAIASSGASAPPDALRVYWALCEWAVASHVRASSRADDLASVGAGSSASSFRTITRDGRVDEWSVPELTSRRVWTFEGLHWELGDLVTFEIERVLQVSPKGVTLWRIGVPGPIRTWPRTLAKTIVLVNGTDSIAYVNEAHQVVREPVDPANGPPVVVFENGPQAPRTYWTSSGHFVACQRALEGKSIIDLWSILDGKVHQLTLPPELSALAMLGVNVGAVEADASGTTIALHWGAWILLWDLRTGRMDQVEMTVNEKPSSIRIGPSGDTLALSQSFTRRTLIYDRTPKIAGHTPRTPFFIETYAGAPVFTGAAPGGPDQWLTTSTPGLLRVWDIRKPQWGEEIGQESKALAGPSQPPVRAGTVQGQPGSAGLPDPFKKSLHCTAFSPDASTLISGSNQGVISIWRNSSQVEDGWGEARELVVPAADAPVNNGRVICDLAFSPASDLIASAGYDGVVRIFDVRTGKPLARLAHGETRKTAVCFTPDGASVLFGTGISTRYNVPQSGLHTDTGGEVWRWDFGAPGVPVLLWKHPLRVSKLARQPGGPLIASLCPNGVVALGVATGPNSPRQLVHPLHPRCMAFNPGGDLLVTAADDHIIRLWDVRTGTIAKQWTGYEASCADIAFHPLPGPPGKSVLLFTLYGDGKIYIWDTRTGEQVAAFPAIERERAASLSIAPDGTRLVASGFDGTFKTWDLAWFKPHIKDTVDFWRKNPPTTPEALPVK
ncbi:MAG: serine/threonine-protein kinase [Planctomycetota bacterium]